jgi:2-C-methyl-D-erythritol 2,4-cyclodiphosphate synthase
MKVGIGQDSHKFDFNDREKKLVLGGVVFENHPPLEGNSDADVILHSITNAISGITCVNVLGPICDALCLKQGIKDSRKYVGEALKHLSPESKIVHVSISIECSTPKITPKISEIRTSISKLLDIPENCVGITATTGEGLTSFGLGKGIQVFSCITVV